MKRSHLMIYTAVIAIVIGMITGLVVYSSLGTKQVVTSGKSTQEKCVDKRSEYVAKGRVCLPCESKGQDVIECILDNTKKYGLDQNEFTENDVEYFSEYYYVICHRPEDYNDPTNSDYEETNVIVNCFKDPSYDWGDMCSTDSDCAGISCNMDDLVSYSCVEHTCMEDTISCEYGCTEDKCKEAPTCAQDVKNCADGTYVSRDPKNNCEFPVCETDCKKDKECSEDEICESGKCKLNEDPTTIPNDILKQLAIVSGSMLAVALGYVGYLVIKRKRR